MALKRLGSILYSFTIGFMIVIVGIMLSGIYQKYPHDSKLLAVGIAFLVGTWMLGALIRAGSRLYRYRTTHSRVLR